MFLFFLLLFTPAFVHSQGASNIEHSNNPNGLPEEGTLFSEQSKILLTGNFILVELLIPFAIYDVSMK